MVRPRRDLMVIHMDINEIRRLPDWTAGTPWFEPRASVAKPFWTRSADPSMRICTTRSPSNLAGLYRDPYRCGERGGVGFW